MAIQKNIETESGLIISYWVLLGMPSFNRITKTASIIVGGYINKDARDVGKEPASKLTFEINNYLKPVEQKVIYDINMVRTDKKEFKEKDPKDKKKFLIPDEDLPPELLAKIGTEVVSGIIQVPVNNFDTFMKDMDSGGWQYAGYNYLKTFPEFADSTEI